MNHIKNIQLARRVMSCDVTWLIHRARIALGIRGPVPCPEPFVSQIRTPVNSCEGRRQQLSPIKVIVFSHNLDLEGASISLKELVVGLVHRGVFTPEIVAFEDGPLRSEYAAQGIAVQVVPGMLNKVSTLKRLRVEVDRLAGLIRTTGAGLVLANTLLNFPAVLAAEQARVPSVWIIRESEPWDRYFCFLPDPVAQHAVAAIGLPKRVVFVAHATRKGWDAFDKHHSFAVIHNGINLNRFPLRTDVAERARCRDVLGLEEKTIAILSVGTLCDRKGQIDLVEAITALPEAIVAQVRVLLVGQARGKYAEMLKKRCQALPPRSRDRIRVLSPTDSIASFYAAADLFVLSSKVESFPRVVLEAMAFGLPIITTPVFGVLEQVIEGENALFYSPGDSRMLAQQIEYLARDDARRLQMAERSRQRISQMTTFDEMVTAYADVAKEALS